MGTIFFTSDLHFGHDNILKYCNRPWKDIESMNEALIENFNDRVSKYDEVYILGDFSFKMKKADAKAVLSRLNGNKHLIVGNHDLNWEKLGGFGSIHTLFEMNRDGFGAVLCHYPLNEWKGDGKGNYMIHGHSHYNSAYNLRQRELGIRRYDIGVDANDYKPVAIEEITDFFNGMEYRTCWEQNLLDFNKEDFANYTHG